MAKGTKTGGRAKGTPNKISGTVKDNVIAVFDELGGVDGMRAWASENQTDYYRIYSKLLPNAHEGTEDGPPIKTIAGLEVTLVRPESRDT